MRISDWSADVCSSDLFDLLAVDMQVLHIIALSSSPVTPSAIAETSDIPPSSITRILDRLETRGFIRRAADGFDQRRTRIEAVREAIAPVKDEFETFAHDMRSKIGRAACREKVCQYV